MITADGTAWAGAPEDPGEYSSRTVFVLRPDQRESLRQLVRSDPEAAARLDTLRAEITSLPDEAPPASTEIFYEGLVNTDPRRIASVQILRRLEESAARLQYWQATGDEAAAGQLREAVLNWARTYRPTGNDVNEYKLFPLFVAYHGLRETFSAEDRRTVDAWIEALGTLHEKAVTTSDIFTNRYTKHLLLLATFGAILERPAWSQEADAGMRRFVAGGLRADGTSLDLERRDSLTYHTSALRPILQWLIGAGSADRELYAWTAPSGGSIQRSVLFVVPYALGEKHREEWKNTTVDLDRRRAAAGLTEYQPGKPYKPRQALPLLEEAAFFEPSLLPLVRRLHGAPDSRYPSWTQLVIASCRPRE